MAGIPVYFFSASPERYLALAGLDLEFKEEKVPLQVIVKTPSGLVAEINRDVPVKARDYGEQRLTMPASKVDLDEKTLARAREEGELVNAVLSRTSPERFWQGGFLLPVKGRLTGPFGYRRILNGQERSRHAGVDLAAPLGTPVRAANAGRVALVGDLLFSGKSVILDHGSGLFTLYFHLQSITVKEDQTINRGQVLGLLGKSGRATGPNLHWGVRLNGARVDPIALTRLPLSR